MEVLERELLALSSIAEEMIFKACRALRCGTGEVGQSVIDQDSVVNQREVIIEEECLKIFALHQPVAVDLRRTATILKINNDLERIADLAVNVSERALALVPFSSFTVPPLVMQMSEIAIEMVRLSLDAFVTQDYEKAQQVCASDIAVDELNRTAIAELTALMKQDANLVEPALHCFSAARHLERIADHATNISEDVMYLIDGEIARHRGVRSTASVA